MLGMAVGLLVGDITTRLVLGHPLLQGDMLVSTLVTTAVANGIASLLFYLGGKAHALENQVTAVQRDAAEARLKLLESQLEPHMLFNTLANLRVLIAADPARAQTMLDQLIAYLRATLGAARQPWHTLEAEFARLNDYLALMAVRMGPRLHYQLQLPPSLAGIPVAPLLLQPLVENAIRHGLEPQPGPGQITVQALQLGQVRPPGCSCRSQTTAPACHRTLPLQRRMPPPCPTATLACSKCGIGWPACTEARRPWS
jgi:LytS/YehU family sensor histidine kinase